VIRFSSYKKGKVGHSLHDDDGIGPDDQTRKMKVKYKLGEEEDKEKKEMKKADLAAQHAREKESLSAKHDREKDALKEDEQLDEISAALAGRYIQKATQDQVNKKGIRGALKDKTSKRAKGIDTAYDRVLKNEELELDESQTEHWKKIQSMDKGSLLAGKDGARKKLDYLRAVHDYHKKYGNDTKKVKSEIERIHRSRLAETTITEGAYEKAEENKRSADSAKKQGDMFAHHLHMADHHDNMAEWHSSKGRHGEADKHAEKAEQHHEKAMSLKEQLEEKKVPEPTGDLKDACWKGYTAVGMKMKNGKKVPNCVPVKEANQIEFNNDICPECEETPCVCDDGHGYMQNRPFDPFFKESAVDVSEYEENWEEHIFADEDPSEEEIEHFMHHISDDDIYDLYDEDELTIVDDETGEELPEDEEEKELDEEALMEVLSRIERMKAKFRIRRTKAKRERATKIALKRYSNTKTINKRSRRLAVKMLKKRLLRGRDVSKLSVGEKERVERVVQTRKKLIDRLAMRLAPRVRKVEKARLSHGKVTKGSTNVAF
jgi:hypothetical protein